MRHAVATLAFVLVAAGASACSSVGSRPAAAGSQLTVEGEVLRVDTAPWAYDGSAVVSVADARRGRVDVQLPARWNLCKAPPPDGVDRLRAGERVRATGTLGEDGSLVVCERAEHRLLRLP